MIVSQKENCCIISPLNLVPSHQHRCNNGWQRDIRFYLIRSRRSFHWLFKSHMLRWQHAFDRRQCDKGNCLSRRIGSDLRSFRYPPIEVEHSTSQDRDIFFIRSSRDEMISEIYVQIDISRSLLLVLRRSFQPNPPIGECCVMPTNVELRYITLISRDRIKRFTVSTWQLAWKMALYKTRI